MRAWAWRVAVAGAAAAVFGHGLLALPLWRDEVASVAAAARPVAGILALLRVIDATHGTYYLLLHATLGLGDPVVVARVFSLVCGVAAVVLAAETARRAAGYAAGTAVAALVIGNPFFATYAREARPFALGAALVCAATLVLLGGASAATPGGASPRGSAKPHRTARPRWRGRVVGFTVLAVLATWVHLFDLLPVAALLLCSRWPWRRVAACAAVIAVAVAPLLWVAAHQTVQVSWMTPLQPDAAVNLARDLAGGTWILYPLLAALLLRGASRPGTAAAAAALAGPVVLLAVSYLVRPVYVERYVLASVPLLALAVGPPAGRSLLAAGVAVLVGLAGIPGAVTGPAAKSEDLAAAAASVATAEQPGDCIAFTPSWARLGLTFHLRRDHAGLADVAISPVPPAGLFADERPVADVTAALARCPRIWVAGYPGQAARWDPVTGTAGAALAAVRSGFTASPPVAFGEFSVALWTAERVPVASGGPAASG